jgi:hypothetical protein
MCENERAEVEQLATTPTVCCVSAMKTKNVDFANMKFTKIIKLKSISA